MESSTRKKNTMIIAGMVVLTILAFLLINFFSGPGDNPGDQTGTTKQDLIAEIEELESSIVELEVVFSSLQFNDDMKESLLEEKREEITKYTQKIAELEDKLERARQQGNVDQTTIQNLQSQLDTLKNRKNQVELAFSRQEVEFLYMENKKLVEARDSLMLLKPDSLMLLMEDLQADLDDCSKRSAAGVVNGGIAERGNEVSEGVVQEMISALTKDRSIADLVLINNDRDKNTRDEVNKPSYKAKDMDLMLARYQITDENIEKFLNGSEMYLVVTDQKGKEVASNRDNSVTKNCAGRKCVIAGEGVFKSGDGISFSFQPAGGKWQKGETYTFSIYVDGTEVKRRILLLK